MTLRRTALILTLGGALALMWGAAGEPQVEGISLMTVFQGREWAVPSQVGRVAATAAEDDRTLILDSRHHRLLETRGKQQSFFGGIGNGADEFFYPTEMALDPETGRLAIYDGGNLRIQLFDRSLRPAGRIALPEKVFGLSWWHQGHLLVGAPETGGLLAVFDESRRFAGTLGQLADPPQLATVHESVRELYRRATSRMRVATTAKGEVWVAFIHLPLIRRYSRRGELTLERPLDLDGLGVLTGYARSVWDPSDQPASATFINIDGLQLALVVKDIAVHPGTGRPILLLGNDWIAGLSADGRIGLVGEVSGCRGGFNRLGVDAIRRTLMLTGFATQFVCEVDLDEVRTLRRTRPLPPNPQRITLTPDSG
jgi:hypothetical protein